MAASSVALAISILEALPQLITASEDVLAWIRQQVALLEELQASGADPSDADWALLDAQVDDLRAALRGSAPPVKANEGA